MNKIETVQRKFTKYIKGMHHMSYENRLRIIKLPSLEYRQLRGDLIQVFKIAKNFYDPISTESIFDFETSSRLRGHMYKINKQITNKTKYSAIANFFTILNRYYGKSVGAFLKTQKVE